jgi:DNA modification methylase
VGCGRKIGMYACCSIEQGDCLELLKQIPSGCLNMVLCDLPFGGTHNAWDRRIPLNYLWEQYRRVVKPNAAIVLFGTQPYTSELVASNPSWFRYSLVWRKTTVTGYLNAKKMPLRQHEDILVFYGSLPTYNPQKTSGHARKVSTASHKRNCVKTPNYGEHGLSTYDSTERYPTSVLDFPTDKQKSSLHPTQKPVALMEYLIRTYTDEGDLVLDNCMGSGTTAVAATNSCRHYLGFDISDEYCEVARRRIALFEEQLANA